MLGVILTPFAAVIADVVAEHTVDALVVASSNNKVVIRSPTSGAGF